MKKINSSILALCTLGVLSTACIENSPKKLKRVELNSSSAEALLGDEKIDIRVINSNTFSQKTLDNKILRPNSKKAIETLSKLPQGQKSAESISQTKNQVKETLLLGLPFGLIGEQNIFGGVITDVTDTQNEELGMMKLADLEPLHVKTVITGVNSGAPAVTLIGCAFECSESSQLMPIASFPIVGIDQEKNTLIVDMSAVGQELDLVSMIDPEGENTQLKAIGSSTVNVEYSLSTLIFDVKTDMTPIKKEGEVDQAADEDVKITSFNVRWYLKLTSGFNPAFEARSPTEGVGFFTTDRSAKPKILRFATPNDGSSVHYYVKGVPERHKKNFSTSINNWNEEFRQILGRDLLSYEFVDVKDPRYNEIVTGDIRYNVIEWELKHSAPYVGYGPAVANQFTGEIFSANVLVQGVMTEEMFVGWFKVSDRIRERQAQGKIQEAQKLLKDFNLKVQNDIANLTKKTFKLKLGKNLEMRVSSQRPELQDQLPKVFELAPEGVSYEEYVDRYMLDTIEHELGHNLGLRHNFKGSLGAVEGEERGSASRSIMEYMPELHAHKSAIGEYDFMALAYGYKGIAPKETNWFCTDEHQVYPGVNLKNVDPECSQNDATNDPYEFYRAKLNKITRLIVNVESADAPVWEPKDLINQLDNALLGMIAYAASAEKTADKWIGFFDKEGRPTDKSQVSAYVIEQIKGTLCNSEIEDALALKSPEAKQIAQTNLSQVTNFLQTRSYQLGFNMFGQLSCQLVFKF